jgi:hypothetical protein
MSFSAQRPDCHLGSGRGGAWYGVSATGASCGTMAGGLDLAFVAGFINRQWLHRVGEDSYSEDLG